MTCGEIYTGTFIQWHAVHGAYVALGEDEYKQIKYIVLPDTVMNIHTEQVKEEVVWGGFWGEGGQPRTSGGLTKES